MRGDLVIDHKADDLRVKLEATSKALEKSRRELELARASLIEAGISLQKARKTREVGERYVYASMACAILAVVCALFLLFYWG